MTPEDSRKSGFCRGGIATVAVLTLISMTLFAANSLLCRMALFRAGMDAVSYTVLRTVSAAAVLWGLTALRGQRALQFGSWGAALALFGYMACFSWAYINLSAAAGALIIAVAVQVSMVGAGMVMGQRPNLAQTLGIGLAMLGLVYLLLPGLDAPPLWPSAIIFLSGAAWAAYTLLGRHNSAPAAATAGNFVRCLPLALLILPLAWLDSASSGAGAGGPALPFVGIVCALAAGGLASALGYVLWYSVLPRLNVPTAAVVQLSVPLITAFGGVLLMNEAITLRLGISTAAILGGIFCATALTSLRRAKQHAG